MFTIVRQVGNEAVTVNGNSEYVNVINNRIENIGNIGLDFAGHFLMLVKIVLFDQARYCGWGR